ncbi:MAG: amidohydrolase [Actinomycetia bacterium]|nr:amidohydrolase [Actinomycetes bacterium]
MTATDSTGQSGAEVTVYPARSILTMDPSQPRAEAVAVSGGRILAVGSLAEVRSASGPGHRVNESFRDRVVTAGLIDQHLHPVLGASTLTTEVIAPEEWVMPTRTFAAATTADDYDRRLAAAHSELDEGEWLFSWGYHNLWHGDLDRRRLDSIVGDRPTAVWQRSCHEWFLSSAAITELELTPEKLAGQGPASAMIDLDRGHFWENGWMVVLAPYLMPRFLTEERFRSGLAQFVDYLHMNGVTAINEPGISWQVEPWHLYEELLGAPDVPFSSTFLVDGRDQSVRGLDPASMVDDANQQVARAPEGKVRMVPRQVKLFADGAIISQLMQMTDGYLDRSGQPDPDHHGEWIMEPEVLRTSFDAYWDAGWQIHIHVNGDLGLEVLLDIIEDAMDRHPRIDHRTVIVHFATSTEEQVDRIARLGAVVSANPYYPVGFADKYSEVGLGPARADVMARSGSVVRRGIPLSFHSDLPMGPSDPLVMASYAVNRITPSGRVVGPEQRISVQAALEAVTIGAAHSWQRENDLGSIEPGKLANFTVLADDPFEVDPTELGRIKVEGTVFEGAWFPVSTAMQAARASATTTPTFLAPVIEAVGCGHRCGCEIAQFIADQLADGFAA